MKDNFKIILFRHGLAMEKEDFAKHNSDDSKRPLIKKGKLKVLNMSKKLKKLLKIDVDYLITSPYTRAAQTTQIIKKVMGAKKVITCLELIPSALPTDFFNFLKTSFNIESPSQNAIKNKEITLVVVGHEPQLSLFASWVLTENLNLDIQLKKSGILGLEIKNAFSKSEFKSKLLFLINN